MRSRLTTAKHRRRPELSPASFPALIVVSRGENRRLQRRHCRCPPDPGRPWLTGLGPVRFFAGPANKLGPFRPNIPNSVQRSSGKFLLRAGNPIRSDPTRLSNDFF
ncbi:hypothetical protein CRG98_022807 [Punica granatum]|uniref:Uncharacterized protein n=1 Tax=Punica granatum TaxID=22663 RepID=A0A2I0JKQ3_PUNGR|nr:hypothetical protein CRG98_022807 [Punica granatum]